MLKARSCQANRYAGDRAADVVGDLPRLVERAGHQQHAEFVAAEARDRVGVAHRIAQQLGDLAQHGIARQVTAGVVDDLEAIEIEVTQHVWSLRRGARLPAHSSSRRSNSRRFTSPVSASCVAWYDIWRCRPRSSVTSCSSTTAPTSASSTRSGEAASSIARSSPRGLAEQHRAARHRVRIAVAAAHGFPAPGRRAACDRSGRLSPRSPRADLPAACGAGHAQQLFRGGIQVDEPSFDIGGHDGFGQRLQREHLQRRRCGRRWRQGRRDQRGARGGFLLVDLAAGDGAQLPGRNDFDAGHQQRGGALEFDRAR